MKETSICLEQQINGRRNNMELNTTKQDMLERFRLYGEIYCTLATMPGNDYMDDVRIEVDEICDVLDIDEDDMVFNFGDESGRLDFIKIEDDMMTVWYYGLDTGYNRGWTIIRFPTDTIRKLKDLLERYVKALKEEEA